MFKKEVTPSISLQKYIQRFLVYGDFSNCHLIAGLLIVKRFFKIVGEKSKNLCIFKVYAISLLLVHKFIEEVEHWSFEDYGLISGYSTSTLLALESLLCEILEFRILVSKKEIEEIFGTFECQKQEEEDHHVSSITT